jgi:TolB-like protein
MPRKGLRFVGPVRQEQKPVAAVDDAPMVAMEPPRAELALADKPSIAVLPFANMSGDPEQEYFADGMVEEIITALSHIRWLFVIARNSSFTYKGRAVDVRAAGQELGVRYVLEGSVRKAGQRVRISAQLIEATTGAHLWADAFDGSLEDVFELQYKVAIRVAGVIEPALQVAETARLAARPTDDLTAYDLYLRALPNFYSVGRERLREALDLLEQAIARDPLYAPALGLAAVCDPNTPSERLDGLPRRYPESGCRLRAPGPSSVCRRPLRSGKRGPGARLFRRGHRGRDCADGPLSGREPELRLRLVF